MKKILLLSAALLAMPAMLMAQDYAYMRFTLASGESLSFRSSGLEITFSGGNAVVKSQDGDATLPLQSLVSMAFSQEASAIESVEARSGDGKLAIFSPSGSYMGSYASIQSAREGLPQGLYLVRSGGITTKTILR